MRRILLIILAVLILTLPVLADEADVIAIDPFTGEPTVQGADETASEGGEQVYVNGACFYDRLRRSFGYPLGTVSNGTVYASVAYGMVTTDPVSVTLPDGVLGTLYRDGKPVDQPVFSHIADPGSYVLSVSGGTSQSVQPLSFTIVNGTTGLLDSYRMPEGFSVTGVQIDGVAQPVSPSEADMLTEGEYYINYDCDATGLSYTLHVNVDHTPPVLALSNVRDGRASGPVDISDVEEGCSVGISCDGKAISYNERLTQSGVYRIVLTDLAGNTNVYDFIISFYFNVTSILFILIVIAIILGLLGYLIFTRKHLRVR